MRAILSLVGVVALAAASASPHRAHAAPPPSGWSTSRNYDPQSGLSGWPARVQNASDATLRAAYANGTCVWLQGEHGGGMVPPGAASDSHVTVSNGSKTCHVFKKASRNPPTYFPATCI